MCCLAFFYRAEHNNNYNNNNHTEKIAFAEKIIIIIIFINNYYLFDARAAHAKIVRMLISNSIACQCTIIHSFSLTEKEKGREGEKYRQIKIVR